MLEKGRRKGDGDLRQRADFDAKGIGPLHGSGFPAELAFWGEWEII
jgi:hypothetical protein